MMRSQLRLSEFTPIPVLSLWGLSEINHGSLKSSVPILPPQPHLHLWTQFFHLIFPTFHIQALKCLKIIIVSWSFLFSCKTFLVSSYIPQVLTWHLDHYFSSEHMNHAENLLKHKLWLRSSGWSLSICISNHFPEDTNAIGPWTTFWVATIGHRTSLSSFSRHWPHEVTEYLKCC